MMNSFLIGFAAALFIMAVAVGVIAYFRERNDYEDKLAEKDRANQELREWVQQQDQRIAELEHAHANLLEKLTEKRRNPYLTDAGLENATAVLLDIKQTLDYLDVRAEVARKILGQIRRDPSGYNEDAPNGKKPIAKEE